MSTGGLIASVVPDSLAGRVGLQAGDELIAINGHRVRDVIDVLVYSAEDHLALQVRRHRADEAGGNTSDSGGAQPHPREFTAEADRRYDEPLGLEFVHPTFDGIRRCDNRCEFCFVAQMAPGLRSSLYVKDDDYRYSFLFGNYITLTNLDEADWQRIAEQHLSPLYVSVHATEPDLRRRMLHNPSAPDVVAQLRRLGDLGIGVHTQIVVVPGLNDGPHLDRSIADLAGLAPGVCSVSVVPVGLTRYHRGDCRLPTLDEARAVLEQVTGWQARLRGQVGVNLVYLSDEWYLRLHEEVPPLEAYDGLDLTENGVGLVRRFLEDGGWRMEDGEWRMEDGEWRLESPISSLQSPISTLTLVTGELFAPILRQATAHVPGVEVVPVVNHFFGETVTVAGLLAGQDVVAQLRGRELGERVVLPAAMFGGPQGQSLDEMWPEEVGGALGRPVVEDFRWGMPWAGRCAMPVLDAPETRAASLMGIGLCGSRA